MREKDQKSRRLQQAEDCVKEGRYDDAVKIYESLTADCPEEESLLLALAWAYYDAGRLHQAVGCFEQLFTRELSRHVFTGFAYDELVRIYKTEKYYDRLVNVCERATAAQPQDTALLRELAAAYLQADRGQQSLAVCKRIMALEPDTAAGHVARASLLQLEKRDPAGAIAEFRQAIRLDPGSWIAHNDLGKALLVSGDVAGGVAEYREAARLQPDALVPHSNLAFTLAEQNDLEGAEREAQEALRIKAATPLPHFVLGIVRARGGKLDEAIQEFREALKLDPTNGVVQNQLGMALGKRGDAAGALAAYQEAVRLAPKFAAARANLGSALFAKGDRKTGFEEIRIAHELAPQNSHITAIYEKAAEELKRSERPTLKR